LGRNETILEGARDRGCHLELNAQPDRLDLDDTHTKLARDMGIKLAVSCDAHAKTDFGFLHYGIDQARRGWLEKDDVLNTRTWKELEPMLRRD